jgi:hypothetical protein
VQHNWVRLKAGEATGSAYKRVQHNWVRLNNGLRHIMVLLNQHFFTLLFKEEKKRQSTERKIGQMYSNLLKGMKSCLVKVAFLPSQRSE